MTEPEPRQAKCSIGYPAKRITLHFEPVTPPSGPVNDGPLIRVRHPVAAQPVRAEVEAPLAPAEDGGPLLGTLRGLVGKVSECEQLLGRPALAVNGDHSGVAGGKAVVSVSPSGPTDPAGAVETCKRVADALFALVRTIPGATVRVVSADQPDRPIYEPAA